MVLVGVHPGLPGKPDQRQQQIVPSESQGGFVATRTAAEDLPLLVNVIQVDSTPGHGQCCPSGGRDFRWGSLTHRLTFPLLGGAT